MKDNRIKPQDAKYVRHRLIYNRTYEEFDGYDRWYDVDAFRCPNCEGEYSFHGNSRRSTAVAGSTRIHSDMCPEEWAWNPWFKWWEYVGNKETS